MQAFDTVLSDMCGTTTGIKAADAINSLTLAQAASDLSLGRREERESLFEICQELLKTITGNCRECNAWQSLYRHEVPLLILLQSSNTRGMAYVRSSALL